MPGHHARQRMARHDRSLGAASGTGSEHHIGWRTRIARHRFAQRCHRADRGGFDDGHFPRTKHVALRRGHHHRQPRLRVVEHLGQTGLWIGWIQRQIRGTRRVHGQDAHHAFDRTVARHCHDITRDDAHRDQLSSQPQHTFTQLAISEYAFAIGQCHAR